MSKCGARRNAATDESIRERLARAKRSDCIVERGDLSADGGNVGLDCRSVALEGGCRSRDGEGKSGKGVHDDVDPEKLYGRENRDLIRASETRDDCDHDSSNVRADLYNS